ncbi:CBS domain-containing protein [Dolichospermum compactum]|uniref:Circadian input-output histidine kinase CikA n=1 Tax=Dolichospermum compactum NIES-806 TaxID=1973481 RepID=A0A1Z4V824_9CYAN|nr:CBS domain-containing protein [Dolichospermum compactum]BAZ87449.1 multi-sensor hybrid histidine kinase [Dolichospermum compactum NIES-806]
MLKFSTEMTPSELHSAIIRDPLIVTPETTVMGAITQMSGVRVICNTTKTTDGQPEELHLEARSSCVLVVEAGQLVGILTERDIVRLSAQQRHLENLAIKEVMAFPVVTLYESEFSDLFAAINLLQQYHTRQIPVLDEQDQVVGLVTHESLRQTSRPIDLLRLRTVSEVMTNHVICAAPDSSMLAIAQLMAENRVSSVIIVQNSDIQAQSLQIPVGMITERDIVQFQALGLHLETCLADAVMSTPIFYVTPEDSLWAVQQIMEQRLIRRLAVTGSQGELLGIVTQTNLLQALKPLELYRLAEVLEEKILRLKAEKIKFLENRAIELEKEVAARTIAFQTKIEQQKLVTTIATQIRSSLSLQTILETTVTQVRSLLGCDRVNIWRLNSNGEVITVAESTNSSLSLIGRQTKDACFSQNQVEMYRRCLVSLKDRHWDDEIWSPEILDYYWQGQPRIVADVMKDIWTDCLAEYSLEGQIQSKIVAPILQEVRDGDNNRWIATDKNNRLWGVLVVHACLEQRVWKDSEAQLLQQIANQLAIAIQQANLFDQLQTELAERLQTEAKLTETNQKLAISNEELARATRLKDEFLANMSHELRTPLNAILGLTEVLQDNIIGTVNERQLKALKTIERSGNHLLELINDILDVTKIEAGQIELDLTAISVNHLCQSSVAFVKQQALKKNIQIHINVEENLPNLLVDERRIRQVLINLLNNAVKFTPEGGQITVEVTQVTLNINDSSLKPGLQIAVTDTGIGIAPENIHKLFRPFIQIDSALNRQYSGTGLGLTLVKRIVELHDGNVGLTSALGVGSCFTVELPCCSASEIMVNYQSTASSTIDTSDDTTVANQTPLILLAEDNEANIITFFSYLEARGYRVVVARDGQEAIDMTQTHQPDLILMDIQMPKMDGIEAMRQIRLDANLIDTPIIALTALAMTGDRDRTLEAGANDYLTKPVKLKELAISIQKLLK